MARRAERVSGGSAARTRIGIVVALLWVWLVPLASVVQADAVPVTTHHNNNQRTGLNPQETILAPTTVSQSTFGELFTRPLDGNMFGQPLYVPALTIRGGNKHDVVFAATEHNSVYAYDADSNAGEVLWKHTLPDVPAPLPNMYCCGYGNYQTATYTDIKVELGITSTPAIDTTTNTIFVVAFGQTGPGCTAGQSNAQCNYQYTIHALDLSTGDEKLSEVVAATAPGCANYHDPNDTTHVVFQAKLQTQRPALLLTNGSLYLSFGSFKDDNPYHGWVMRYDTATLAQQAVFNATPNASCANLYSIGGGLWNSGEGPTVDPDTGDLYFATGNGSYNVTTSGGQDISDSVIRLDKNTLTLKGYFTPFDVDTWGRKPNPCNNSSGYNCFDLDFGSAGVLAIPGTHLLLTTGKVGRFFVLDRSNQSSLGGRGTNADNDNPTNGYLVSQSFKATRTQSGCLPPATTDLYKRYDEGCFGKTYGTPVFWHGPNNDYVYIWPRYDSLKQVRFNASAQAGQNFLTTPDNTQHDGQDVDANIPNVTYMHERPYDNAQAGSEYTPAQGGGMLSLSANTDGTGKGIDQTGILWAATPIAIGPGLDRQRLTAYNAQDVTQKLFDSGDTLGLHAKFVPPTISNGRVYLPAFYAPAPASQTDPLNANRLHVFGLLTSAVTMTAAGFPNAVLPGQQHTITVTLKDKNGNTAVGYHGTVQLTSSDPAATLPAAHTFTDGDAGSFTFPVTLNTAGVQTITAFDNSAGGYTATQTNISVFGVTGLSVTSGSTNGGTVVTITGAGFAAGVTVTFGGTPTTVTGIGGGGATLTVTTPPHVTGTVDVVVTLGGVSATLPQAYTFILPNPPPAHTPAPTVRPVAPQPMPTHLAATAIPGSTGTPLPQPVRH